MSESTLCKYCGQFQHFNYCDEAKIAQFDGLRVKAVNLRSRVAELESAIAGSESAAVVLGSQSIIKHSDKVRGEMTDRIAELEAQLAEAQKDKEYMDWVCEGKIEPRWNGSGDAVLHLKNGWVCVYPTLRQAIDAAIEAENCQNCGPPIEPHTWGECPYRPERETQ